MMKFEGKAWKFGPNINTDVIIPGRYLNVSDPKELAKHCMEDHDPQFAKKIKRGDIIVADTNFGCGSSREHAPIAIKAAGISCVVAKSFARIFYRNAFNMGLAILESTEAADGIGEGDRVQVDMATGKIQNLSTKMEFQANPMPEFMIELLNDGGLMKHVMKKIRSSNPSQ
jgi:3-isopropylmalate/(R)-2-methylmalate dehydratase small subunit